MFRKNFARSGQPSLKTPTFIWLAGWCLLLFQTGSANAQAPPNGLPKNSWHLLDSKSAPGTVAKYQAAGNRPGVGTFTAVSIIGPEGMKVGLAAHGQFLTPIEAPVFTGMLVGAVYRFRVTNIPDQAGEELYPTLEIIDRVYPEPGREHRHPIPIVIDQDDMLLALRGALVTRVIYLEDSSVAEPIATRSPGQLTLDVGPTVNALRTADQLGRPLAILRIGSRVPNDLSPGADLSSFMHGCPPWIALPTAPNRQELIRSGQIADMELPERVDPIYSEDIPENYPRVPVGE